MWGGFLLFLCSYSSPLRISTSGMFAFIFPSFPEQNSGFNTDNFVSSDAA